MTGIKQRKQPCPPSALTTTPMPAVQSLRPAVGCIVAYPETGKIGNSKICLDPDMGMRFSCKRSHSMSEYLSAGRPHKMKVR
jgi:hypothetical protein